MTSAKMTPNAIWTNGKVTYGIRRDSKDDTMTVLNRNNMNSTAGIYVVIAFRKIRSMILYDYIFQIVKYQAFFS